MSPLNITQPLGLWSIIVYNGYYKVMSNIPKMGQLPTPAYTNLIQSPQQLSHWLVRFFASAKSSCSAEELPEVKLAA